MWSYWTGQKVVCVNASNIRSQLALPIKEGEQYVVRWVGPLPSPYDAHGLGIRLTGITRPTCKRYDNVDMPFRADRFHPLVDTKSDISLLTRLLKTKNKTLELT